MIKTGYKIKSEVILKAIWKILKYSVLDDNSESSLFPIVWNLDSSISILQFSKQQLFIELAKFQISFKTLSIHW